MATSVNEIARIRAARAKLQSEVNIANNEVQQAEYNVSQAAQRLKSAEDDLKFAESLLSVFNEHFPEE